MNKNYKLYRDSELSEKQIETDVASYLGYVTPLWSKSFRLTAVDEQETGSDKLFNRFVPIYLQFKVSNGLKPLAFNFNLLSPNRPLQRIRNFRRQNNISADPTLYFRLRDKALTAVDFQHNILKSFHTPPKQFAMYVAPLTLSIDEYNRFLNVSLIDRLFTLDPFLYGNEQFITGAMRQSLNLTPFLRGHVSIPPHVDVTTSDHYYSYSKSGSNIAWHSGEKLKDDFRLSTQMKKIFQIASNNKQAGYDKEEYLEFIDEFFELTDHSSMERNQNSLEDTIRKFAYLLREKHDIKLMLLEIDNST